MARIENVNIDGTDYDVGKIASTSDLGVVQVGSGLTISSDGVLSATGGGVADSVAWGHITGTMADQTDLTTALAAKANSADLATVATSGDYDDLTDKPTIGNATLTIQKNGTSAGTFTANATSNKTINITVPTTAADVSALPASTKYGASIAVSINTTDYKVTTTLKDQDGNTLGTAQVIDLPLESVVVNGSYDSTNKKIVLTLQNGNTIDIPVGDLVAGLQSEITSTNKLASDLVDDTNQTHKFMTSAEKTKLSGIAAGAEVNVQANWTQTTTTADDYIKNKPTLAAVATSGSYNDLSNKPTIPAAQVNSDWNATSGVARILNKPALATVATSGSYNDLLDKPTLSDEIFFINVTSFSGSGGSYSITMDKTYSEIMSAYQDGKVLIMRADVNSVPDSSFPASSSDYVYAELWHVEVNENAGGTTTSFFFVAGETSGNGRSITAHSHIFAVGKQSASYNRYFGSITVTDLVSNVANPVSSSAVYNALATKANSADLATVATSGSYNDLSNKPTIPTVNNATLTIQKNGTNVQTFTANQSTNATANITVPTNTNELTNGAGFITSSGTAAKANQLTTARTIAISGGATGTATSFNGTSNISIPVTNLKDAYVTWGGKNLSGDLTPDDMGCIDEFGHNKLAYLPAECIQVHYSTDGGTTWTDYGLTDAQKIAMVTTSGTQLGVGKNATITADNIANMRLRVRIASGTMAKVSKIYSQIKKMLINVSTNGAGTCKVAIRRRTIANYLAGTETWTNAETYNVSGWSGWNSIPYTEWSFGGSMTTQTSQWGQIEFVFWSETYSSSPARLSVIDFRFIGATNWTTPSEIARAGHLYTMDTAQNATFPANVNVTGSLGHGSYTYTLPNKNGTVAMTSDIPSVPTVNNGQLTIQKNGTNVTTFTANQSGNATANITVPTKTSDITNDSNFVASGDLATVATSGSYNDLSNKPTIPAAQVQSNWTQTTTTAVDYIKNKPTLATVATSGSYNDLSNKPTIPTVNNATLTIQKNGTTVKTFTANASSNVTANITVPTKTSDLTNDSNFVASTALATVATSGSYNDLSNKPTIPTVNNATLTIQKNGSTVKTFTANASSNVTANITVPTALSDLSGTVSSSQIADGAVTSGKIDWTTLGHHHTASSTQTAINTSATTLLSFQLTAGTWLLIGTSDFNHANTATGDAFIGFQNLTANTEIGNRFYFNELNNGTYWSVETAHEVVTLTGTANIGFIAKKGQGTLYSTRKSFTAIRIG